MNVDLLIQARWIIPVEPTSVTYKDHALIIKDGKIIDILPAENAKNKYQPEETKYLSDHALIPGLINSHTHASMSLMRGIADDLPLMDWLQNHIWPLEQKWIGEEFVRDGTDLAIAEMIRGGTTCFNDMYFFSEITAQQAVNRGIRAGVGLIVLDFPSVWANDSEEYINKGLVIQQQYRDHSLITTPFAPHAPYTVSDRPLKQVAELSNQLDLPVHMHLHETLHEVQEQQDKTNQTPIERCQQLGLLNSKFMAVHMTQLTNEDITIIAQSGANIIHCPESNLKLASGFCPVAQCLDAGINVAIGTDGAASNNDLDMLGEMRTAALLAKGIAADASAVPAKTALQMATINGAKAMGIDHLTGSLSIGKAADVVAINLSQLETQPIFDPVSQIVYAANRQQVSDVWVEGKALLTDSKLTTIDLDKLMSQVQIWQRRLDN